MLRALYDVMNHPERYRAMWRDGELYIEAIADKIPATDDVASNRKAKSCDFASRHIADFGVQSVRPASPEKLRGPGSSGAHKTLPV